jgi:hypothetical protein
MQAQPVVMLATHCTLASQMGKLPWKQGPAIMLQDRCSISTYRTKTVYTVVTPSQVHTEQLAVRRLLVSRSFMLRSS